MIGKKQREEKKARWRDEVSRLPGEVEEVALDVYYLRHLPSESGSVSVQLKISNYRIWTIGAVQISFYLGDVSRFEVEERGSSNILTLHFRDTHIERFQFPSKFQKVIQSKFLKNISPKSISNLYAFQYSKAKFGQKRDPLWNLFDLRQEFEVRMGVSGQWILNTEANRSYELCQFYPQRFYVPANVQNHDLFRASFYRVEGRVPLLCWRSPGAVICRASRPDPLLLVDLVGMTPVRNEPDRRIIQHIRQASHSKQLWILNVVGLEEETVENKWNLERKSKNILQYQYFSSGETNAQLFVELHEMRACRGDSRELTSKNGWFQNLDKLLVITSEFARRIRDDSTSLVIQSQKNDEICAQLSSLIQLMVDPYYRTMKGFGVLVEKEWMYLGHKFCDFTEPEVSFLDMLMNWKDPQQEQPTYAATWFLFLDAVSQLLRSHPEFFEFNESFLVFLVDHTFSCRFGNFLTSCEKERRSAKIVQKTASIWGYLFENAKDFVNPFYQSETLNLKKDFPLEVVGGMNVGLWDSLYFRHAFVDPLSSQNND